MERMTRGARQSTMMSPRQVRGTVLAVLLCSALAGCGSATASAGAGATSSAPATSAAQAASSAPASPGSSSASASATSAAAASATGCAGADQATSVTVHRVLHLVEPTRGAALSKTQHNATLVRALFRQLCAAVSHPSAAKGATLHCPADFGIVYLGTFYDGSRTLAKFSYGLGGGEGEGSGARGRAEAPPGPARGPRGAQAGHSPAGDRNPKLRRDPLTTDGPAT